MYLFISSSVQVRICVQKNVLQKPRAQTAGSPLLWTFKKMTLEYIISTKYLAWAVMLLRIPRSPTVCIYNSSVDSFPCHCKRLSKSLLSLSSLTFISMYFQLSHSLDCIGWLVGLLVCWLGGLLVGYLYIFFLNA